METRRVKKYVYDAESYKSLFTLAVINVDTRVIKVFEISERCNESELLTNWLNQSGGYERYMVGFNNTHYDDILLAFLLQNVERLKTLTGDQAAQEINNISQEIINTPRDQRLSDNSTLKPLKYHRWNFHTIDLFKYWTKLIRESKKISLKGLAANMGWYKLQDLPYDPQRYISVSEVEQVISYNINDILVTDALLNRLKTRTNLRINIAKNWGIRNALTLDDVNLGMSILKKYYYARTGHEPTVEEAQQANDFNEIRVDHLLLHDKIQLDSTPFQTVYQKYRDTVFTPDNMKFKGEAYDGQNIYQFGTGGLHTKDKPVYREVDSEHYYIASDVVSYYPNLVMQYGFFPQHLGTEFLEVYRQIYKQRLRAKKVGDHLRNATFKLSLNGMTGMLRNYYSWAYDPVANLSITINGQLLLATLIEKVAGFATTHSANTDGIEVMVHKSRLKDYMDMCKWWENHTHLQLEHTYFSRIFRRDVNAYMAEEVDESGKVTGYKLKGMFEIDPPIENKRDFLIVSKALYHWFSTGNSAFDYIERDDHDIRDFCAAPKVGRDWQVKYMGQDQQRLNRFYVSRSGFQLTKHKEDRQISMLSGHDVKLLNNLDLSKTEAKHYDINYDFYKARIQQWMDTIVQPQQSLFE